MYIVHSVLEKDIDLALEYYGHSSLEKSGFIHCSDIDTYELVAPNFKDEDEERILLVIDKDKVKADIKWEDGGGIDFPHIYGLLNTDSIVDVLEHKYNEHREWIKPNGLDKYK